MFIIAMMNLCLDFGLQLQIPGGTAMYSEVENRLSSVLDRLGNAIASGTESPEKQGAPSVSTLRTEKDEVFEILAKWKNNAVTRGQEQARKDCEKIIKFLRTVCP